MAEPNRNLVFLVVSSNTARQTLFSELITRHVPDAVIYCASNPANAVSKLINAPPQVLITDYEHPKVRASGFIEGILADKKSRGIAVIISEEVPEKEKFLDELVTGRVQFLGDTSDEEKFVKCLFKAINHSTHRKEAQFYLRFVAKGDLLIRENEKADFVYIVKRGRLSAFKTVEGRKVVLGSIQPGEFVGEMAYVNGEPRTASVEALEECEVVEIPVGTLEGILYKRPGWSHKLLVTLSKRLKNANESRVQSHGAK